MKTLIAGLVTVKCYQEKHRTQQRKAVYIVANFKMLSRLRCNDVSVKYAMTAVRKLLAKRLGLTPKAWELANLYSGV